MNKIIKLNENDLKQIILESITEYWNYNGQYFDGKFKPITNIPNILYHSSNPYYRNAINKEGIIAQEMYTEWWEEQGPNGEEREEALGKLPPMIFLSTEKFFYCPDYNDVWEVDTTKLDRNKFYIDPSEDMVGCFCYEGDIPRNLIKCVYINNEYDNGFSDDDL